MYICVDYLLLCSKINMFTLRLLMAKKLVLMKISRTTQKYIAHKKMMKGILFEVRVNCSLMEIWYKNMYHEKIEDWLNEIWFKVKIVKKCLKFLIDMIFFYFLFFYNIFLILICHCNIRFPNRIMKVIKIISINKAIWGG